MSIITEKVPKSKMTFRWTDTDTLLLIQLYKTYPFLWDSSHQLYKNSIARMHAYASIVEKMDRPLVTIKDIRSKIKNLRTSYYLEVKKMSKAQEMGMEYSTKLTWFDHFKEIMDAVLVQKETHTDSDESFEFIEENSTNSDAYVVTIKQEYLDEMEKQGAKNMGAIGDYLEPAVPAAPKRFKTKHGGFKETKDETPRNQAEREQYEVDEFQLFANNMAEQLRKLPIVKALSLQVQVQTLVANARINMYKKKYDAESKSQDDDE